MSDNPDIPEIPAHIAGRKAMALTPQTAELVGQKEYMDDSGRVHGGQSVAAKRATAASQKAARDAEAYAGPYPLAGLTPAEIQAIRGKVYPDTEQPKMTPQMGDRTPAWVNWLWSKYPWDAAKRFGGTRLVWPTVLPANWPPAPPGGLTLEKIKAAAALLHANELPKGTRLYTQAEVEAMIADLDKQRAAPLPGFPHAPKKRIRNRSKKPAPQPATV